MVVGTFGILISVAIGYMVGRKEERNITRGEIGYWKRKYESVKKENENDEQE